MRGAGMRAVLGAVALLAALAGSARADDLPCVDFVSSGAGGPPMLGWLIGASTVTIELQVKPGGIGTSITETFSVGVYEFTDGSRLRIDCRDYTLYPG